MFTNTYERINESKNNTLEGIIKILEEKINEVKSINLKGGNQS
jgi:hypothetical protein